MQHTTSALDGFWFEMMRLEQQSEEVLGLAREMNRIVAAAVSLQ
jgi:hypothetical protein